MSKELDFIKYGELPFEGIINSVMGCFAGTYLGLDMASRPGGLAAMSSASFAMPVFSVLLVVVGSRLLAVDLAVWRWKEVPYGASSLIVGLWLLSQIPANEFQISHGISVLLAMWAGAYAFAGLWGALIRGVLKFEERRNQKANLN